MIKPINILTGIISNLKIVSDIVTDNLSDELKEETIDYLNNYNEALFQRRGFKFGNEHLLLGSLPSLESGMISIVMIFFNICC